MSGGGKTTSHAVTELRLGPGSDPADITDPDADIVVFANAERYELRTTLGEGGMGEVRLCRDRVIGREVALKLALEEHASKPEIRARFVREARVQAQLEHPSIVPVYDFGLDAQGRAFFTMKRLRGVTLERIFDALRRGDQATARAYTLHKLLAAFVQVCLTMDFAHERGVLHRDLKPANVMFGDYGEVYVLDWGLAKVRSASHSVGGRSTISDRDVARAAAEADEKPGTTPATAAGSMLGTPGYMAPEQIRGEASDARTDVYGLGGILFEILALEPLHGEGPVAQMMARALAGVEARASVRVPLRQSPPELEAVCVRACAKDPAARFGSARELADAIEAYLSGDRDVELRRELAEMHLAAAKEAALRTVGGGTAEDRRLALRELGRAIALVPDDAEARALLVRVLTAPPREPPAEVLEAVDRTARESQRRMLPRAALAFSMSWAIFFPLQIAIGIADLRLALVPLALWTTCAALAWIAWKFDHSDRPTYWYVTLVQGLALATTSLLHGPLLVVPALGGVITMGIVLQTHPRARRFSVIVNVLAVTVPSLLAWAGVHPVAHTFVDGAMIVSPGALRFPRDGTFVLLTAVHVLIVLTAARYAALYRDATRRLEIRSQLQAWQLRHLVPEEAASKIDAPPSI
ncbi:MAG TPA: serine/threonine-protein kinase [Labilithrix sp.]